MSGCQTTYNTEKAVQNTNIATNTSGIAGAVTDIATNASEIGD
jgi:hypothetical protein